MTVASDRKSQHFVYTGDAEVAVPAVVRRRLKCYRSVKRRGNKATVKITDGGIRPLHAAKDGDFAYPSLVVEVAYSETLEELRGDGRLLLGDETRLQIFIGLKVPYCTTDTTKETKKKRRETGLYTVRVAWRVCGSFCSPTLQSIKDQM